MNLRWDDCESIFVKAVKLWALIGRKTTQVEFPLYAFDVL